MKLLETFDEKVFNDIDNLPYFDGDIKEEEQEDKACNKY